MHAAWRSSGSIPATTATAGCTATTASSRFSPSRSTRTCGASALADLAGLRRRGAPGGAVQRSARAEQPRGHPPDQPPGFGGTGARCHAGRHLAASSTPPRAASTAPAAASSSTSRRRSIPRPPMRTARSLVERDLVPLAGAGLCSGVPAQRHRLRSLAAHALRHRDQRPVRARLDHPAHRHDQRRQPLAPGGARGGHLRGDLPQPHRAGERRAAARSSTSGRTPRTTGCASSRRSWPRSFRAARSRSAPRQGDNRSYRVNFDRIAPRAARLRVPLTRARDGVRQLHAAVRAHPDVAGDLPVPRLYAPEAAQYLQATRQIDADFYWR